MRHKYQHAVPKNVCTSLNKCWPRKCCNRVWAYQSMEDWLQV